MSIVDKIIRNQNMIQDRWISLTILGTTANKITAVLTPDHGSSIAPQIEDNHFSFRVPGSVTGGGWIFIAAKGFKNINIRMGAEDIPERKYSGIPATDAELDLEILQHSIEPLASFGAFFRKANGEKFTAIGCTDFRLYEKFLTIGKDALSPIMEQRAELGFNIQRILGMCGKTHPSMFRFFPQDFGDVYYERIPEFYEFLANFDMYGDFVITADATIVIPNLVQQQNHVARVSQSLLGISNQLASLVNENDQTFNHIDSNKFLRPIGILCSHGSNGSQQVGVRPPWSYEEFHTNGAFEEQRKIGHNAMEISSGAEGLVGSGLPVITTETSRCPEVGMWVGRTDEDRKKLAFSSAKAAALLCAGSYFHSVQGKASELFTGIQLECAREWVRGAKSINLEYQDGQYYHAKELEGSEWLRVYQRILGDGTRETAEVPR